MKNAFLSLVAGFTVVVASKEASAKQVQRSVQERVETIQKKLGLDESNNPGFLTEVLRPGEQPRVGVMQWGNWVNWSNWNNWNNWKDWHNYWGNQWGNY